MQWESLALGKPPCDSYAALPIISPFSPQTLLRQNQRCHYPFASTQANKKGFLVTHNQARFQSFLYQQTLRSIHSPQFTWPQGKAEKTSGALLLKRKRGQKKKKKTKKRKPCSQRQVAGQKQVEQSDHSPQKTLNPQTRHRSSRVPVAPVQCGVQATWSIRGS